jgi:phosphoribosylaminoimidazolecarboxamide formyltransferase / IMP cyclohydrolase
VPLFTLAQQIEKGEKPKSAIGDIIAETAAAEGGVKGSVMISDAFFPEQDGVMVGIRAGATAVCHPGGSIKDADSIEACNKAKPQVAMAFTGQRAFKH